MKIIFDRKKISDSRLVELYKSLLLPRVIEERMLILIRQGRITKWFSGIGQEAVSVGCALAMKHDEFILTMHRNLGVFTVRDVPLQKLFLQFLGKENGYTQGHDRSFHFGSLEHYIVGMITHLGAQLSVADGIGLSHLLSAEKKATLVFTGDGGASEGEFHEALNVAAVWELPVIFVVENNHWGLSTPTVEQYHCKQFIDKGIGYGMEAIQVDGNNILEVIETVKNVAENIRNHPAPVLVECMTFRQRGHEEASGTKYYPEGMIDAWKLKDPIINFENYLIDEGVLTHEKITEIKEVFITSINNAWDKAVAEPELQPDTERELRMLFKPYEFKVVQTSNIKRSVRYVDAISEGLQQSLRKYDNLIVMGQDIAGYGGVFKVTKGMVEEFGKERIRNTPICESAIIGVALGLSINGIKAIVEMQFADFVSVGFSQIVNNLAKIYYRWQQNADVVIRMPTGAGVGAGPFHSQSNEAWFTHVPGLKIVYPAFPEDAKGLLCAAIEDPNPVMYFEHKALYRTLKGAVSEDYFTVEIGKANVIKEGNHLTIISYGMGVHWALEVLEKHEEISADLIDLRTLSPLDTTTIFYSVNKTGKAIILHEDTLFGGLGGEISALITENCFEKLDAPVVRVGSLDTPVPFAPALEKDFLPKERFEEQLLKLWKY